MNCFDCTRTNKGIIHTEECYESIMADNKVERMKPSNDREAISLIIDGLIERGVTPVLCRDGDNEDLPYTDKESALDWLTSCDESVMFVDLPAGEEQGRTHIYFVLGNEPEEVAADCGVSVCPYLDPITEPWW